MRALRQTCLLAAMALAVVAAAPATQPANDPATARGLVQNLLGEVLAILRDPQLTDAQRSQKVRDLAYQYIDFQALSRLTLARNWRGLSDDQCGQFVDAFRKHLSATYAHITDDYSNEDLVVTGDRQEPDGDCTVQTLITGAKQDGSKRDDVKVNYRLRQKNDQWKVIDVTIDGVSMVANFRAQFQEIMSNGGFDRLLQLLREKNAGDDK
jgi:phospholipid transport system substrate-binding protein